MSTYQLTNRKDMISRTEVIPQRALELATHGGWSEFAGRPQKSRETTGSSWVPFEVVALDPAFWQALGKSLGWNESFFDRHASAHDMAAYYHTEAWLMFAHNFCDLIYQGQSTEEFWKELLK
jgi:hypothetical protein